MERSLTFVEWRALLAATAHALHGAEPSSRADALLGDVTLHLHQLEAVGRIERALARFGGALLADDVGLGKTFVALAVAQRLTLQTVIAVPASLREMWIQSARRARMEPRVVSLESLALRPQRLDCGLLIVDEAHNLRNPNTRRYKQVALVARNARVLLLSATPVHNKEKDLHSLLALFLGSRAASLEPRELALIVVRRERDQIQNDSLLPAVIHAAPPALPPQDSILDAILALPAPVPPVDGGDGGALVTFTLVRQWSSSHAAFARALRRRLVFGHAMLAALDNGIYPNASELQSWCASNEAIQLPLFGLLPRSGSDADAIFNPDALSAAVRSHLDAVRNLLSASAVLGGESDDARAREVQVIQKAHPGAKIVAFSQFAETVRALFKRALPWGRAAMLTASTAAIASGRIPRAELISLFAPIANGAAPPPDVRRVDLLFSTDVLSEGTNLQDASVLIHLDLPWTPVRLTQRVGRVARAGSLAREVTVYSFPPPANAESLLRMERRLSAKLSVAARTVGVATNVLPLLHISAPTGSSPPQLDAQLRELLRGYMQAECNANRFAGTTLVSGIICDADDCLMAVVEYDGSIAILCGSCNGGVLEENPGRTVALLRMIAATDARGNVQQHAPAALEVRDALAALQRWGTARSAYTSAGLHTAAYARARRRLIRRIDTIAMRTPTHLRPRVQRIAATARKVATNAYGSAAEQVLSELADATMSDEAWLRAVQCFGELQRLGDASTEDETIQIRAVLIVRRGPTN